MLETQSPSPDRHFSITGYRLLAPANTGRGVDSDVAVFGNGMLDGSDYSVVGLVGKAVLELVILFVFVERETGVVSGTPYMQV